MSRQAIAFLSHVPSELTIIVITVIVIITIVIVIGIIHVPLQCALFQPITIVAVITYVMLF